MKKIKNLTIAITGFFTNVGLALGLSFFKKQKENPQHPTTPSTPCTDFDPRGYRNSME